MEVKYRYSKTDVPTYTCMNRLDSKQSIWNIQIGEQNRVFDYVTSHFNLKSNFFKINFKEFLKPLLFMAS